MKKIIVALTLLVLICSNVTFAGVSVLYNENMHTVMVTNPNGATAYHYDTFGVEDVSKRKMVPFGTKIVIEDYVEESGEKYFIYDQQDFTFEFDKISASDVEKYNGLVLPEELRIR